MSLAVPIGSVDLSSLPTGGCGHEHLVEFYETEGFLIDTVSSFVSPALHDGDAAIVVATATHRSAFEAQLGASGVDVAEAVAAIGTWRSTRPSCSRPSWSVGRRTLGASARR